MNLLNTAVANVVRPLPIATQPRLGFIGTGWIGRLRMDALLQADIAEFCTVYDPSHKAAITAAALSDGITISRDLDELLDSDIDGVVIATPSALHAEHCLQALAKGKAVFCQKPLARTREETQQVIDAARAENKLLGIDFSYRYLAGMSAARNLVGSGTLGEIYAADLIFHNAYGPDKRWFYDVKSSGGGCVMDLGIHLIDSAMWLLSTDDANTVTSDLFQGGKKLHPPYDAVEDYALVNFMLGKTHTRMSCSWNLHAGRDAMIEIHLHGTQGGLSICNINGSFYDFEIHHFKGTSKQQLAGYPDAWGGRALVEWVKDLERNPAFNPEVEQALRVADVIDRIYCR
jgi:predicted dehydrogenase